MGIKSKVVEWLMPSFIDTLVKDLSDPSTSKHLGELSQRLPGTINKNKAKKAPKCEPETFRFQPVWPVPVPW